MFVELMDYTAIPEHKIAQYAAICYDADTSDDACERRIKKLMNLRHLATLRFAYATFHIGDISRITTHQIVRHPHLSFLQRSQRYTNEAEQDYVTPIVIHDNPELDNRWQLLCDEAHNLYIDSLQAGVRKEDARYILPQGTTSEMYATGNFQAWHDFLTRRLDRHAQWEIRAVAQEIHKHLMGIAPNIFGGLNELP